MKAKLVFYQSFLLLFLVLSACKPNQSNEKPRTNITSEDPPSTIEKVITRPLTPTPDHLVYPFKKEKAEQNLYDLTPVPENYQRVKTSDNSFAEWLRYLPAKPKTEKVKLYNGNLKPNQNAHFAILDVDVGNRDLQQCADAVMRLRAEYCYSLKAFSKIHFNFTSGDKVAFEDWSRGRRPKVSGNKVTFSAAGANVDTSYPNFKKYMRMIFNYAGTASLSKELVAVPIEEMQIGDLFIQGDFPGHAVIVVDMVENSSGKKKFILAQSYMPAQDIHVLKNYKNSDANPWYDLDFGTSLATPEWHFNAGDLKRFRD